MQSEIPLALAYLALALALLGAVVVVLTWWINRVATSVLVVVTGDSTGPLPSLPQDDTPARFDEPDEAS
jgi:hypothetical protein